MTTALIAQRVAGDVDVLSRAGLDLDTFLSEAIASIARAVPWVAACVGTHDPASRILTGARKYGDLLGRNDQDLLFGLLEYDSDEPTSFPLLAAAGVRSVGVHERTGGDVASSERMARLMQPAFGYEDEARLLLWDEGRFWGGIGFYRGGTDRPFSADELDFLAGLSQPLARGVRRGLLARMDVVLGTQPAALGPAVLVVGGEFEILQSSPAALARLSEISNADNSAHRYSVIAGLVGAARRVSQGSTDAMPHARLRTDSGTWLVLHASPLSGAGDRVGEVVVTIEEARPPEIVSLVVAAFDLTPRERDVTQLVLQGVDTKEIASTLHLSAYTVQDHLKSIFDKADVRSRRELIARVFFDQYVPRMGAELGPSGWFAPA